MKDIYDKEISSGEESVNSDEYVVEEIITERWSVKNQRQEFFIKWEGFGSAENTWEPKKNLYGCPEKWEAYNKQKKMRKFDANNDEDDFISDDANSESNVKKATKRIIKPDKKKIIPPKRHKIASSESEDTSAEDRSSKPKNKIRKKDTNIGRQKEQKISIMKESKHRKEKKHAKIDVMIQGNFEKGNKINDDIQHNVTAASKKEKQKKFNEADDDYENKEIFQDDEEDNIQRQVISSHSQDINLNDDSKTCRYEKDEEMMKTKIKPIRKASKLKKITMISSLQQQDSEIDHDEKSSKKKFRNKTKLNFTGKWWNNLILLPDEKLLHVTQRDRKNYTPIKLFDIEKSHDQLIRIATSNNKNCGIANNVIESIVGIVDNPVGVDQASSTDAETDKHSMALIKFIGLRTLYKIPLKLVENTEHYSKYLIYVTSKWSHDKRGEYWNHELQESRHWMADKAITAFNSWKKYE